MSICSQTFRHHSTMETPSRDGSNELKIGYPENSESSIDFLSKGLQIEKKERKCDVGTAFKTPGDGRRRNLYGT